MVLQDEHQSKVMHVKSDTEYYQDYLDFYDKEGVDQEWDF